MGDYVLSSSKASIYAPATVKVSPLEYSLLLILDGRKQGGFLISHLAEDRADTKPAR